MVDEWESTGFPRCFHPCLVPCTTLRINTQIHKLTNTQIHKDNSNRDKRERERWFPWHTRSLTQLHHIDSLTHTTFHLHIAHAEDEPCTSSFASPATFSLTAQTHFQSSAVTHILSHFDPQVVTDQEGGHISSYFDTFWATSTLSLAQPNWFDGSIFLSLIDILWHIHIYSHIYTICDINCTQHSSNQGAFTAPILQGLNTEWTALRMVSEKFKSRTLFTVLLAGTP